MKQNTSAIKQNTSAMKQNTSAIKQITSAMKQITSAMKQVTNYKCNESNTSFQIRLLAHAGGCEISILSEMISSFSPL